MIEKTFIQQGIKRMQLEEYFKKELEKAGYTKSEIVKTPLVTRIVVNVTRPGLAIGKAGQNIKQITDTIQEQFKIENPQLEIKEIQNPDLDAQATANKIKNLIETGYSWRSIVYRIIKAITEANAQGVEITLSGKLAGKKGRKRKQRIAQGYMKKVGDQTKLVDYGKAAAYPRVGAIGIKVRIVHPDTIFPDKVNIKEKLEEHKQQTTENKEETKKTEDKKEPTKTEIKTKEENKPTTKPSELKKKFEEAKPQENKTETKTEEKKEPPKTETKTEDKPKTKKTEDKKEPEKK
jgi:small subunit ribosomal protein S3